MILESIKDVDNFSKISYHEHDNFTDSTESVLRSETEVFGRMQINQQKNSEICR